MDLLTELQAEFEAARERPREDGEAAAVRQIAEIVGISEERAARVLASIEAEIATARQLVLRRIAEAWLEGQRKARPRWEDKARAMTWLRDPGSGWPPCTWGLAVLRCGHSRFADRG